MLKMSVYGDTETIEKIRRMTPQIHGALLAKINTLAEKLVRHVKVNKLSGQVLHVRTNRLRSSIAYDIEDNKTSIIAIVGTNVEYAPIHEFGFSGTLPVRAHMRRIKSAWGKPIKPTVVNVSAHSRTVNLPERSFLRSALADMTPKIREEIAETVAAAARQAMK